jgi:hypothetical protein
MDTGLTKEQVLKNLSDFGYQAPTQSTVGGAFTRKGIISQDGTMPISAGTIGTVKPLNLAPTPIPNGGDALSSITTAVKESGVQSKLEQQTKEAEGEKDTGEKNIRDLYNQIAGVQDTAVSFEEKQALDKKEQRATDYTNQLEGLERSELNEIRALEQGVGTGMSTQGKAESIAAVRRKYAFQKADVALLESAANRDFETAQNIITRKIDLALQPLKTKLEIEKFFYEENSENFTTAEQRQYDSMLKREEREIKKVEDDMTNLENTKIKLLEIGKDKLTTSQISTILGAENKEDLLSNFKGMSLDLNTVVSDQLYSGLNTKTANAVKAEVSKFKTEPAVKTFNVVQEGYNFAQQLPDTTTNPVDDQALIYQFAKIMDPDSVVREGEYATVQRYSQSWVSAYGKSVSNAINGTGFLSEEARANIKKTLEARYNSKKQAYDSLRNSYATVVNNISGKDNGKDFLTDYVMEISNISNLTESQAESNLQSYVTKNPDAKAKVSQSIDVLEKSLGREPTALEILQAFPEYQ